MDDFVLWGGKAMLKAIVVAAAVLSGAQAADAAVMQATWTGTVTNSTDNTDSWGTGSFSVSGLAFSATVTYDTLRGLRTTTPGLNDSILAGSSYGVNGKSPIISATLTINGRTLGSTGDYETSLDTSASAFYTNLFGTSISQLSSTNGIVTRADIALSALSLAGTTPGFTPASLDTPFVFPGSAGGGCGNSGFFCRGSFQFSTYDSSTGITSVNTYGSLLVSDVSVAFVSPSPVPLPASALLLGGAVAAAAALRRTNRRLAA